MTYWPGDRALIAPLFGNQPVVIDTTQFLGFNWTEPTSGSGSGGQILFYITTDTGEVASPALVCVLDATWDSAIVPANVLAQYKATLGPGAITTAGWFPMDVAGDAQFAVVLLGPGRSGRVILR